MKEALFYEPADDGMVNCKLCPRLCVLKKDNIGFCGVRKNIDGKLMSLVYARPCSVQVDPVEKKPLFHFLPGEKVFSIATAGCNLGCRFCQNWQISKECKNPEGYDEVKPEEVIELCKEHNCKAICYTYTEPTIFYEYMLDIAKLAKKHHIRNVMVSNGYINENPLRELCKYMDAANIDLKGFSDKFYKENCSGTLDPVLKTLKLLKELKVWFEITTLVIPRLNDDVKEMESMSEWIAKELGKETVLHLSAFHPDYKLKDVEPTHPILLARLEAAARKHLDHVYIGNTLGESNTVCPKCGTMLIERSMMSVLQNNFSGSRCPKCDKRIAGIWK